MRGALSFWLYITLSFRIIPADAGSTKQQKPLTKRQRDHPADAGSTVLSVGKI